MITPSENVGLSVTDVIDIVSTLSETVGVSVGNLFPLAIVS